MAKLFALLIAASPVKSRRAGISMTHRLTLPYALDYRVMAILGEHFPADGRMDDGDWLRSPPWQSGRASDRAFAVQAQALSLAVRAPAGWQRHHSLCHAGPASGARPRRLVRCVGALWSGWFWGVCAALRSRRAPWPGSDPAMCSANFSSRPIPGRCPLWGRLPGICRGPVVGGVRALASWWTPVGPAVILAGLLVVLDVMARPCRLLRPIRPPPWCKPYTAPSPSYALRRHGAALGRGQRLRGTGFGPRALVGPQLAEALQCVRVCPYGPAA
jgi:hypothetical protein